MSHMTRPCVKLVIIFPNYDTDIKPEKFRFGDLDLSLKPYSLSSLSRFRPNPDDRQYGI
jgi:hypothetical protein